MVCSPFFVGCDVFQCVKLRNPEQGNRKPGLLLAGDSLKEEQATWQHGNLSPGNLYISRKQRTPCIFCTGFRYNNT